MSTTRGANKSRHRVFKGRRERTTNGKKSTVFPKSYTLSPVNPIPGCISMLRRKENSSGGSRWRPRFRLRYRSVSTSWCRNINLLSIAYAYPPRLRSRLTPGRKTWPGNPWVYGGRGFHPPYRYSCLHPLFSTLHGQSPSRFDALRMLLYRTIPQGMAPRASVSCLIANHFRRRISR